MNNGIFSGVANHITAPGGFHDLVLQSGTWEAKLSGIYRISAVGGGGAGKVYDGINYHAYSGGGAGGLSRKIARFSSGTQLSIVIGAGASAGAGSGGTTTVTGAGIALSASGGGGGAQAASGTATGASGGTASGGDYNIIGGGSGTVTHTTGDLFSGGGAVGWFGVGYASAAVGDGQASGGAGICGSSVVGSSSNMPPGPGMHGFGRGGGSMGSTYPAYMLPEAMGGGSLKTPNASMGGGGGLNGAGGNGFVYIEFLGI